MPTGEPVTLSVHLQDVNVMGEPIQQRAGQPLRSESLGPFVERQITGHQRGAAFIAPAEDLKQELRPGL